MPLVPPVTIATLLDITGDAILLQELVKKRASCGHTSARCRLSSYLHCIHNTCMAQVEAAYSQEEAELAETVLPTRGDSQCTYKAWFAKPASMYPKSKFSLRVRVGSHSLPCFTGRVSDIHGAQRVRILCQTGNPGNEQHPACQCPSIAGR